MKKRKMVENVSDAAPKKQKKTKKNKGKVKTVGKSVIAQTVWQFSMAVFFFFRFFPPPSQFSLSRIQGMTHLVCHSLDPSPSTQTPASSRCLYSTYFSLLFFLLRHLVISVYIQCNGGSIVMGAHWNTQNTSKIHHNTRVL